MNIKNLIKDNVVTPELSQNSSSTVGTIVSIDENKLASVEITGRTGDKFILERIPIVFQGRGLVLNNLYAGDKVVVSYSSNNITAAKITGVYHQNTRQMLNDIVHKDQDLMLSVENETIKHVITQYDMYFSDTSDITDYTKTYDFNSSINEEYNTIGLYNINDIGITHPISKATVKCKEDGSILISSGIDTCVVIDKDGNLIINAKKINITSSLDVNINSYNNINVNCNKFNVSERDGS